MPLRSSNVGEDRDEERQQEKFFHVLRVKIPVKMQIAESSAEVIFAGIPMQAKIRSCVKGPYASAEKESLKTESCGRRTLTTIQISHVSAQISRCASSEVSTCLGRTI